MIFLLQYFDLYGIISRLVIRLVNNLRHNTKRPDTSCHVSKFVNSVNNANNKLLIIPDPSPLRSPPALIPYFTFPNFFDTFLTLYF